MNIPIDIDALDAIFDMAREGKSTGTRAFIDRHATSLRTLLEAFERQAKNIAQQQAQGEPPAPASTPPPAPKEPFDPHTPQAQANRDKRREKRLAEQAGKAAAEEAGKQSDG
jgi:hypothetical protein